jgi:polygalacturonase
MEPPGDSYKPPQSSYSANAPQIAEWTKTAGKDESVILSGYNLRHSDFEIYSDEGINQANVQYRDNEKAIITINKSFKKWSQFLIWPKDVQGYGKPVAVNKTEIWWVGPEISRIGENVSIYGRNLTNNNDTLISYVYLRLIKSKKTIRVKINKANPYKVDFVVPDVLQGIYELWVHNGHGGKWGWSDPILISIEKPINWDKEIFSFNVQTQNPSSLQNIIDKASEYALKNKTFATVKLSEGTLYVSTPIVHKSRVQIKGVRNRTLIKCAFEFENKNGMIQSANSEYISLSDLTIDASGKTDFVNGVINYREKNNFIWLNNVTIISRGEKSFDFHNSAFIFIKGGEVTGG